MKNKLLILSVTVCTMTMAMTRRTPQTWGDWWRLKMQQLRGGVEENIVPAAAIIGANALALGGSYYLTRIAPSYSSYFLLPIAGIMDMVPGGGFASAIIYNMESYISGQKNREETVQAIQRNLEIMVIYNGLFYPTRSSKIHVLLKKDEFLAYAGMLAKDTSGLLEEACNRLIKVIAQAPYSEEQKAEDRAIDAHMADLRYIIAEEQNIIDEQQKLEQKIRKLELIQNEQDSVVKMRGYLSLYYRLKNQLAVEKSFTPAQRKELHGE